jgi:hypothetical protein
MSHRRGAALRTLEPRERWCGRKKMAKWGSGGAFLPDEREKGGGAGCHTAVRKGGNDATCDATGP